MGALRETNGDRVFNGQSPIPPGAIFLENGSGWGVLNVILLLLLIQEQQVLLQGVKDAGVCNHDNDHGGQQGKNDHHSRTLLALFFR